MRSARPTDEAAAVEIASGFVEEFLWMLPEHILHLAFRHSGSDLDGRPNDFGVQPRRVFCAGGCNDEMDSSW